MVVKKGIKRKATGSRPGSRTAATIKSRKTRRTAPSRTETVHKRRHSVQRDSDENNSTDAASEESAPELSESDSEDHAEYSDNTLHPETMQFLEDLAKNNDREWFHSHKEIYKTALSDFKSFSTVLQEEVTKVDWTVPILPLEKHNLFRIHRDIRFSSSKVPYKEYFSVAFSRTGKQGLYAKYYLSVQSGDQSFIGGGLWHPEATQVALMRRAIHRNPRGLKDILISKDFYANFLDPGSSNDRGRPTEKLIGELALKSFVERNSENALKTAPKRKGYDKTHPDIDLLRLKSYTVGKRISDLEILLPNAMVYLVDIVRTLEPFVAYLNSVVMPDIGLGEEAGGDDQQEGDESGDDED
ncbi:hypothetical protein ABW20_dc0106614 [Dactylellina cionopaga]|nr:hypothetical protein ABW20_dc0106614 [Dactylellina cionopaga]